MNNEQFIALCILKHKESCEIPSYKLFETEAAQLLLELLHTYDYTKSENFQSDIEDKSDAYKSMRLKMEMSSIKRTQRKNEALDSIRRIESSNEIQGYFPPDCRDKIRKIRLLLSSMRCA